jgi:hypothetical protein
VWQPQQQQQAPDPYIEWWSLQFDPAAESRAHDHLSSLHYLPVMLQVRNSVYPTQCTEQARPEAVSEACITGQAAHTSHVPSDLLTILLPQDVLQPPECCPPEVLPLLSAAQSAHQAQVWDEALHLLQQAEQAWQEALTQSQQQQRSWSWQQSGEELGETQCT